MNMQNQYPDKINHILKSVFSGIASLTLPICFFTIMLMPDINEILFMILAVLWLIVHCLGKLYERKGVGRKILRIFRILVLIGTVIYFIPTVLLTGFSNTEKLYPVKRYLYTQGVYGGGFYDEFLPEQLPEHCMDYKFITQGSMIAQDYHASSYLIFHTDEQTLRSYEQKMEALDVTKLENEQHSEGKYKFPPPYVTSQLLPVHRTDFSDSVIYHVNDYYDKGCILDYDSGLVIFWT